MQTLNCYYVSFELSRNSWESWWVSGVSVEDALRTALATTTLNIDECTPRRVELQGTWEQFKKEMFRNRND